MKDTLLYIGDRLVDLYPSTVIAITVQKVDIADLTKRTISYTNQIKALVSPSNDITFGLSSDENSTTSIPYDSNACRINQEGLDILIDGKCFVVDAGEKEYSLRVYENLIDIFNSIDGKTLNMVNLIPVSAWTAAGIDSARNNTSGIISAIVNWGKSGAIYQYDYFLPSFFYKTIITGLLGQTGLTISGNILTDTDFTDLIMPFNGEAFVYPEGHASVGTAYYTKLHAGDKSLFTNIGPGTHEYTLAPDISYNTFSGVISSVGGGTVIIDESNNTMRWNGLSEVRGVLTGVITIEVATGDTPTWDAYLILYKNGAILQTSASLLNETSNPTGGGINYNFTELTLTNGDIFYIVLRLVIAVGPDIIDTVDIPTGTSEAMRLEVDTTVNRSNVSWNLLFGNIDCLEVLKDFFTRFGVIPKQVGNELILKTLQEIISDTANALDWSLKKVDDLDKNIDFSTPYAQENFFDYTDVLRNNLGRGTMTIDNTSLPNSKKVFTSVFENTLTEDVGSYTVATIPVFDADSTAITEFGEKPGVKLLTLKARTGEPSITFNAIARTNYKLGYFVDINQSKGTDFGHFLEEFYPLFEASLQKSKKIKRKFNLTALDIINYDPHKMVFDGEGYFIVNRIISYVPGKLTNVELIKMI